MTDSLFKIVHDTVFLYDTLKDTVLVANTALNSVKGGNTLLWTSFIPVLASMVTSVGTLVLFVLTYRKDVKFNKEKYILEQEKYKFEKAHIKRAEIVEKIYNYLLEIEACLNFCDSVNIEFAERYKKNNIGEIFPKLQKVRELFGSARLYLGLDFYILIKDIEENMGHAYLTFNGQNMDKNASVKPFLLKVSELMIKYERFAIKTINEERSIIV